MGTSKFQQGTVVAIDGRAAVFFRKVSDSVWQLEDEKTKRIIEYSDNQLRGLYVAGQLRFVTTERPMPNAISQGIQSASGIEAEMAKIRRLYVNAVAHLPNTEAAFTPIILETWNGLRAPRVAPQWTTVFRWKKRYLHAGKDMFSLLDNIQSKGNRQARYPDEVTALVSQAIEENYLTMARQTMQDTLDAAIFLVINANYLRPQSAQLPWPTRRLVKRMIEAIIEGDTGACSSGQG